ncbi:hypothetical protein [Streptomyces sclerotialus]|uniref:hypothetical protein n=1 Tax=Streptomyces sclerotialus TaxID=1957 RepID=UPI0004CB4FE3
MRDFIETAELSDTELDGIAAGAVAAGAGVAGYDATVTVDGTAVQAVEGLAQGTLAKADGLASTLPVGL